jgi:hypothetical protein
MAVPSRAASVFGHLVEDEAANPNYICFAVTRDLREYFGSVFGLKL